MDDKDLYWLAGFLEGEGSFLAGPPSDPRRPRISVQSTDEDVVRRVADLFGMSYIRGTRDPRNSTWKTYYGVLLRGSKGVRLMRELRPLMGERRQGQIDKAIETYEGP